MRRAWGYLVGNDYNEEKEEEEEGETSDVQLLKGPFEQENNPLKENETILLPSNLSNSTSIVGVEDSMRMDRLDHNNNNNKNNYYNNIDVEKNPSHQDTIIASSLEEEIIAPANVNMEFNEKETVLEEKSKVRKEEIPTADETNSITTENNKNTSVAEIKSVTIPGNDDDDEGVTKEVHSPMDDNPSTVVVNSPVIINLPESSALLNNHTDGKQSGESDDTTIQKLNDGIDDNNADNQSTNENNDGQYNKNEKNVQNVVGKKESPKTENFVTFFLDDEIIEVPIVRNDDDDHTSLKRECEEEIEVHQNDTIRVDTVDTTTAQINQNSKSLPTDTTTTVENAMIPEQSQNKRGFFSRLFYKSENENISSVNNQETNDTEEQTEIEKIEEPASLSNPTDEKSDEVEEIIDEQNDTLNLTHPVATNSEILNSDNNITVTSTNEENENGSKNDTSEEYVASDTNMAIDFIMDSDDPFGFDIGDEDDVEETVDILESFRDYRQKNKNKKLQDDSLSDSDAPSTDIENDDTDNEVEKRIHPNQTLFEILERSFTSLKTFTIPSTKEEITEEDVKLCFVAFIVTFTPSPPTSFAKEYNHTIDDTIDFDQIKDDESSDSEKPQRGWFFRKRKTAGKDEKPLNDDSDDKSSESDNHDSTPDNEIEIKESNNRLDVPKDIVFILWENVLRFNGTLKPTNNHRIITSQSASMGLSNGSLDQHLKLNGQSAATKEALNYISKSLVELGLIEIKQNKVVKTNKKNNMTEDDSQLFPNSISIGSDDSHSKSNESNSEPALDTFETVKVLHDINQQYGESLIDEHSNKTTSKLVKQYRKRWFTSVVQKCDAFYKGDIHSNQLFSATLYPHILISSGKYDDAIAFLSNKSYISKRLKLLGSLECVTIHVTDTQQLLKQMRLSELEHSEVDEKNILITSFKIIEKYILKQVEGLHQNLNPVENNETTCVSDLKKNKINQCLVDCGKALHLLGITLGEEGHSLEEISLYNEALRVKRLGLAKNSVDTVSISDTYHCMGFAYDTIGNFEEALRCYDEALRIRKLLLGDDHIRVAESSHNKGALLCEHGDCEESMTFLEEALRIRNKHFGEEHESCADTQQWMGNVLREWGDSDEALPYFTSALRIKKAKLGSRHHDVANAIHNLAVVLDELGKHRSSLSCYEEALRIRQQNFGNNHVQVADTLLCLGNVLTILNEHEQALEHFRKSIEIRELLLDEEGQTTPEESFIHIDDIGLESIILKYGKLIECYEDSLPLMKLLSGDAHEDVAILSTRMGHIYSKMHDWDNSIGSYQAALKVMQQISENRNVDVEIAKLLHRRGEIYIFREEYNEAQKCLTRCLTLYKKIYGDDSTEVAMAMFSLGISFSKLKDHQQSMLLFTESLKKLKIKASRRDIRIGHILHWLGRGHQELLQYNQALSRYLSALRVYKHNTSMVDPAVVVHTLHSIGDVYFEKHNYDLSLKCYNEEIKLIETRLNDGRLSPADAMVCVGDIYAKKDQFEDALNFYKSSIEFISNCDEKQKLKYAHTLSKIGTMYSKCEKYEDAVNAYQEAHEMLNMIYDSDDNQIAAVAFKLGRVLDKASKYDEAKTFYDESLRIRKLNLGCNVEDVAEVLFFLGKNYRERMELNESINALQSTLEIRRKLVGENAESVALTLHELGKSYCINQSFDKAILCYKECLRVNLMRDSTDDMKIGFLLYDMAKCNEQNKCYDQAFKNYEEALDRLKKTTSNESSVADICFHLGKISDINSEFLSATNFYKESLDFYASNEGSTEDYGDLIILLTNCVAKSSFLAEDYDISLKNYDDLIEILSSNSNENLELLADSYFSKGTIEEKLGDFDSAIASMEKSISIRKNKPNLKGVVASNLFSIGVLYTKKKMYEEASKCLTEALRTFQLKKDDLTSAKILHTLAVVRGETNDLMASKECIEQSLQLRKKKLGTNDLAVAESLHSYGCLLQKLGKKNESISTLEEAFRIRKSKLGINHLSTAETLCQIGEIFLKQKEYERAHACFEQVLSAREKILNPGHIQVVLCMKHLGTICSELQRYDESISFISKTLSINEKENVLDLVDLGPLMHSLGRSYFKLKRYEEASEIHMNALVIRQKINGPKSPIYAHSLRYLGECQHQLENFNDAIKHYSAALQIYKKSYGKMHLTVARTQELIGTSLIELNQFESSSSILINCLAIYQRLFGEESEVVSNIHFLLGKARIGRGEIDKCLECFKVCLQIRKALNEESILVADVLNEIAEAYFSQNKYNESLACFQKSLAIYKMHIGQNDSKIGKILHRVGRITGTLGNFNESHETLTKALSIYTGKNNKKDITETALIMHSIGIIFDLQHEYGKAITAYFDSRKILVENDIEDKLSLALVEINLGVSYARQKNFEEAMKYCREALEIRQQHLDNGHLDIADAIYNIGIINDEWLKIDEALTNFTDALEIYRMNEESPEMASCLHSMASIYRDKNENDEALPLYLEALRIFRSESKENEEPVSNLLFDVGCIYLEKAENKKAINSLKECLKVRVGQFGEGHILVAQTCEKLGSALLAVRRHLDAAKVYKLSLSTYEKEYGKDNIRCADVLAGLGAAYSQEGKFDLALNSFQSSLQIYKNEVGEESEEVAKVLLHIGAIHDKRMENEESMECLNSALEIRSKIFGQDDEKVAETMLRLAYVLEDWGDIEEAMEYFNDTLRIYRIRIGHDHPRLAEIISHMGNIYVEQGDLDSALEHFKEALSILRRKLGEDASECGHVLLKIGGVYDSRKKYDDSFSCYSEAVNIFTQTLQSDDLSLALALNNLGINVARQDDYEQAMALLGRSLSIRKKKLGNDHLEVADALYNIGNIVDDWGKDDQALRFYEEALNLYRINLGDDDVEVANCLQYIGSILLKRNKPMEALSKFTEALRIFRLKYGDNNLDVGTILFSIGRIYGKKADYANSLKFFQESLRIRKECGASEQDISTTKRFVDAIMKKN